jgi:hypothetical protein
VPATCGSLFCAEFGRHISLGDPALSINSPGMYNFQTTLDYTNETNREISSATAYAIFAYDQIMEIDEGGQISFAIPDVASQTQKTGMGGSLVKVPYDMSGAGGGDGEGITDVLRNVNKWMKDTRTISRLGKTITPMLPPHLQVPASAMTELAHHYGYGEGQGTMDQNELRDHIRKLGRKRAMK